MRKLPSIKLLVTFEAAARHLSFKQAAEELFVTPSAVSHQVRTLEEALQTDLFVRSNRSIELTQAGRDYFQEISQAIRTIYGATESLMSLHDESQGHKHGLLIHSSPYLTNAFIVPQIKSLRALFPDVKIAIESKVERASLNEPHQTALQVGLRHGKTDDDTYEYQEIAPILISPVCAPHYSLEGELTKIDFSMDQSSWLAWQSQWGMDLSFSDSLECNGMQAIVDMAGQGLGLAMGYFPFLNPKLSLGELILPFPDQMTALDSLYLAYPKTERDNPLIQPLLSWLKATIT